MNRIILTHFWEVRPLEYSRMDFMASSCGCFEWWGMSDEETLRKRAALEHTPNSGERKC